MAKSRRGGSRRAQNTLRIIAGTLRGSKVAFADGEGLRPTPDRAREMLFNWLGADVVAAQCLDLFAGSAALSFEALSRGAAAVTAVENNRDAAAMIGREARRLGVENLSIHCGDALQWLAQPRRPGQPSEPSQSKDTRYDIAFLDPPFASDLAARSCTELEASGLLSPSAAIYLETAAGEQLHVLPDNWQLARQRELGEVCCTLFFRRPGPP